MSRIIVVFATMLVAALVLNFVSPPAHAENYDVQMLNRGEKGSMVFEPDYLKIQVGDTVTFRATHKSHNAASIEGMVPEGYAGFQAKIDEELSVTFDEAGFYGVRCIPHYTMGQVMLIKVGEAELPASYAWRKSGCRICLIGLMLANRNGFRFNENLQPDRASRSAPAEGLRPVSANNALIKANGEIAQIKLG